MARLYPPLRSYSIVYDLCWPSLSNDAMNYGADDSCVTLTIVPMTRDRIIRHNHYRFAFSRPTMRMRIIGSGVQLAMVVFTENGDSVGDGGVKGQCCRKW